MLQLEWIWWIYPICSDYEIGQKLIKKVQRKVPEQPNCLRDFSAKESHLAVVAGSDMEDSHAHIYPCSLQGFTGSDSSLSGTVGTSLLLVPGRNKTFLGFPKNSLCHWREGVLSFCQVNPHHSSCFLLTSLLPIWQNQVSDTELTQPAEECGQEMVSWDSPLTQCWCGSTMHRDWSTEYLLPNPRKQL